MKKQFRTFSILFSILFLIPYSVVMAETAKEKGYRIMKAIDNLPKVEKMSSEAIFKIYDSQENLIFTKKSRVATYVENYQSPEKRLSRSISYFYAPADDKGNGALNIENSGDKDDDQWIYLKGLRKPKRVIGSDKSSSFMGSDFSNGDVAARDIDDSEYTWIASEQIKFKNKPIPVEKIEARFKSESMREDYGYSKTIAWVHPKTGLVFQVEMYDLNGQLAKRLTLKSFLIQKNKDGKRVFIATGAEMKNMLKATKTTMETKNIKVEGKVKGVKPSMFKTTYLTRK